jgi:signal transduction histidine kinase
MAIINVQAGITVHVLDKRPEQARSALETIERTSARALEEIRTVLGVLRADGDARAPLPGIEQVPELAAKARDAGLDVDIQVAIPPTAPLPGAVGSAVYRILQESLTNVIRHSGPTRVRVAMEYVDEALVVRIVDSGRDRQAGGAVASHPDLPAGHGIAGMRERCRLLGGELEAGPLPDGGFAVMARLPLAPVGARA